MKAWFPTEYAMALNGTLTMPDVHELFDVPPSDETRRANGRHQISDEWAFYLDPVTYNQSDPDPSTNKSRSRAQSMRDLRTQIFENLEMFAFN